MIKSVTVINHLGDSLKMELTRPELSGFIIQDITGLTPPKATVNLTKSATDDGGQYNSASLGERNVVIDIVYLDGIGISIEDLRHKSYKYFPSKKKVKLIVETDTRISEVEGIVESNEIAIFEKQEGSQISIKCPESYLYSSGDDSEQKTMFSSVDAMFEFPFSNESLTTPMIEMSAVAIIHESVIGYNGDSEIGITISIHAVGEASNVTFYNMDTRETMHLDTEKLKALTGYGIMAGDEIVICTVKRKKSAILVRGGETINILNCLDKNTDWFTLVKGDNTFAYTAETGASNLRLTIINRTLYEGV